MNAMKKGMLIVATLAVLGMVMGICFLTTGVSSVVDWRPLRAVALESDDWGLAGFVPSADVWHGSNREELIPGHFPAVYWESTLEDSLMVADLCGIMASFVGADGLPAVFQPNYVMSSLSYEKDATGWVWVRYNLPQFPPAYERKGMWEAVEEGIEAGLWYPEFHATWHYDPAMRLENALKNDLAKKMTKAGVTLFPESEKARELGQWRSLVDLSRELQGSQRIFQDIFERPVGSIIAPDYTWNDGVETMWEQLGVRVIQGKREQRDPTLPGGKLGRGVKFIKRQWALLNHRQRIYLERNCRLEPVQSPQPEQVVLRCTADTHKAWAKGQPAIVETHRVNFAHADPGVVKLGQDSMTDYLESICADADQLPVFMVDAEIAQLQTRGVSWVVRGNQLILRNGTHGRRLVVVTHQNTTKWFALGAQSVIKTQWKQ